MDKNKELPNKELRAIEARLKAARRAYPNAKAPDLIELNVWNSDLEKALLQATARGEQQGKDKVIEQVRTYCSQLRVDTSTDGRIFEGHIDSFLNRLKNGKD